MAELDPNTRRLWAAGSIPDPVRASVEHRVIAAHSLEAVRLPQHPDAAAHAAFLAGVEWALEQVKEDL